MIRTPKPEKTIKVKNYARLKFNPHSLKLPAPTDCVTSISMVEHIASMNADIAM